VLKALPDSLLSLSLSLSPPASKDLSISRILDSVYSSLFEPFMSAEPLLEVAKPFRDTSPFRARKFMARRQCQALVDMLRDT
jgi:ethanolamine ammonia-lyase small subunit